MSLTTIFKIARQTFSTKSSIYFTQPKINQFSIRMSTTGSYKFFNELMKEKLKTSKANESVLISDDKIQKFCKDYYSSFKLDEKTDFFLHVAKNYSHSKEKLTQLCQELINSQKEVKMFFLMKYKVYFIS